MKKNRKKLKKPIIVLIILLVLIIIGVVLFFTLGRINITLNGDKNITLNYNDTYTEQGATAKYLWIDVKDISIDNALNVDTSKVGKYEITYNAVFGPIKTSTKRTIEVVNTSEMLSRAVDLRAALSISLEAWRLHWNMMSLITIVISRITIPICSPQLVNRSNIGMTSAVLIQLTIFHPSGTSLFRYRRFSFSTPSSYALSVW